MRIGTIRANHFKSVLFRIDPSFYLSEGIKTRSMLDNAPYRLSTVGESSERVFIGNIFSRVFVNDEKHGIPYLAASDTVLANLETGRYLSHRQASELSYLILQKDWILATCSGTLGNVSYTNKEFAGKIATHDLIRIVPNDENVLRGCLYAFLASKYGYYQMTESKFGGVVKHINADYASAISVPVFPLEFQIKVDSLIKESARLREDAFKALHEAHTIVEDFIGLKNLSSKEFTSIKTIIQSHNHRLEGQYYISENRELYNYILLKFKYDRLGDLCPRIYRPGIFKREYVKSGVPFLGGADILLSIPSSDKMLSRRQVEKMPELSVKKGCILATCGGTIGKVVIVDEQLSKCAISQHVMRIEAEDSRKSSFLFAFLSSKIGYKLITLFSYGSVIPQVEPHHLQLIPIPIFPVYLESKIVELVNLYVNCCERAKSKELEAISLVEAEIEKWNK